MKKIYTAIICLIPFNSIYANDVKIIDGDQSNYSVSDIHFAKQDGLLSTGILSLNIKNVGNTEILSWKGEFICLNLFGDKEFQIEIKELSANITPNTSKQFRFERYGDKSEYIIKNNIAENFNCYFTNMQLAVK